MLEGRPPWTWSRGAWFAIGLGTLGSSCRFDYELLPNSGREPEGAAGAAGDPSGVGGETVSPPAGGGTGGMGQGGMMSFGGSMGGAPPPEPTCTDGVQNGLESDEDCGGDCPACGPGSSCSSDDDCESLICFGGSCTTASCIDGVQNQSEEETDCGGPNCPCCNPGVFSSAEKLSGFAVAGGLFGPSLSQDATVLYLAAADTDEDLFVATRTDRGTVFSAAAPLGLNSTSLDGTPRESRSGLSLYFYSERTGTQGSRDLMVATRASLLDEFSSPTFLETVNSIEVDQSPTLSSDELRLIFGSLRSGGAGASDLWFSERAAIGDDFSTPVNLTELNTAYTEDSPSLTADELTLFFISNRPGSQDSDIWVSTRANRTDPFDEPVLVDTVSTAGQELDASISADGRELFFSSDVDGSFELWRATRECL